MSEEPKNVVELAKEIQEGKRGPVVIPNGSILDSEGNVATEPAKSKELTNNERKKLFNNHVEACKRVIPQSVAILKKELTDGIAESLQNHSKVKKDLQNGSFNVAYLDEAERLSRIFKNL